MCVFLQQGKCQSSLSLKIIDSKLGRCYFCEQTSPLFQPIVPCLPSRLLAFDPLLSSDSTCRTSSLRHWYLYEFAGVFVFDDRCVVDGGSSGVRNNEKPSALLGHQRMGQNLVRSRRIKCRQSPATLRLKVPLTDFCYNTSFFFSWMCTASSLLVRVGAASQVLCVVY